MASVIKKTIAFIKSNDSLSNYFKKVIYNYRYRPYSQIVPIKDITDYTEQKIEKIADKNRSKTYLPKFINAKEECVKIATPEISIYQFNNVYIDINSSSLLYKDALVTYRTNGERFNEGFVVAHNDKDAKVNTKNIVELEEGFFLGGNGSWNWFHFLIEIMPKITLFKEKYSSIIFVNEIILKTPSMMKILELFTQNKFTVKYLNQNKTYYINTLYHINDFNHIQFNRFDKLIGAEGTFYNTEITYNFSDILLEKLAIRKKSHDKLFLYRKNTHRIAENQDQIVEYLKNFGFIPICLEELDIEEQAGYFQHAKFIIGISGAAWTNMIFCRNKPKAICFVPDNAKNSAVFSNLAKMFDVDLYEQLYSNEGLHTNCDFIINFEMFVELFKYINEK